MVKAGQLRFGAGKPSASLRSLRPLVPAATALVLRFSSYSGGCGRGHPGSAGILPGALVFFARRQGCQRSRCSSFRGSLCNPFNPLAAAQASSGSSAVRSALKIPCNLWPRFPLYRVEAGSLPAETVKRCEQHQKANMKRVANMKTFVRQLQAFPETPRQTWAIWRKRAHIVSLAGILAAASLPCGCATAPTGSQQGSRGEGMKHQSSGACSRSGQRVKQVLLTPFAVAADAAIVGGALAAVLAYAEVSNGCPNLSRVSQR